MMIMMDEVAIVFNYRYRDTYICSTVVCFLCSWIDGLQEEQHEHGQRKRDISDYKKNNMSTDREYGRGNKRARVTRGSRNPKHGKLRPYIVHKPGRLN
jgi:hypothetical protein